MTNRPWSPEDDAHLRERYDLESGTTIAARLGRSKAALYKRAETLGLKKSRRINPPEYRAPNYSPIGATCRAGRHRYLFIKVSEGSWPEAWRAVHHLEWERRHGPVPADCVLTFRDGNVENTDADNLELVRKQDWIKRYIPEHTLPPELAAVIRMKAVLSRAINERTEDSNEQ